MCAVLGGEAKGIYANKLNFIGGGMTDRKAAMTPAEALLLEAREELGLDIDSAKFVRSIIGVDYVEYEASGTKRPAFERRFQLEAPERFEPCRTACRCWSEPTSPACAAPGGAP